MIKIKKMIKNDDKNDQLDDTPDKNDITTEERELLDDASDAIDADDQRLKRAQLDSIDQDGIPLAEMSGAEDLTGGDLDIPGSELDDAAEEIGEEDEENNGYSQADTE
jgi:hypothetical protein